MLKKSFKFKVLIIFTIPAIALIYFSFYFVSSKYDELLESSKLLYASKVVNSISSLIHSIQKERGLSSGYVVAKDKQKYKKQLIKQREITNNTYEKMTQNIQSLEKRFYKEHIYHKAKPHIADFLKRFYNLKSVREDILESKFKFDEVINYFSSLNRELLKALRVLVVPTRYKGNFIDIYSLQELKESAGLERAYVYNALLSGNFDSKRVEKILSLIVEQNKYLKDFQADTSLKNLDFYNEIVKIDSKQKLEKLRTLFFEKKLNSNDALKWFEISTKRIDELQALSNKIVENYLKEVEQIYNGAKFALLMTILLWIISLFAFMILIYILNKLINTEAKLMEDLKIASYAFKAHEAMTITDPNGKIIKVNEAFTKITGYKSEEVIGKNPKVLKSEKHSENFYKEMWRELHTNGYWCGDIYNKRKNGEIYPERLSITAIKNEEGVTTHYIAHFIDITELENAKKKAMHLARHDFLTKLPNRGSMIERLKEEIVRAKRHEFLNAFLFIDVDNFKKINDYYGHAIGDELLKAIAGRFKKIIRKEDYVARISGDEFCIVLLELENDEKKASLWVKNICQKILEKISQPFFIFDYKLRVSISIGVKIFPLGDEDVNSIINKADTAMYKAKNSGKNRFYFYDREIEHRIKFIKEMEVEIKNGLKKGEFEFYFQPKVSSFNNLIVGAELLVRWNHPTKGLLFPDSFLSVAKDTKLLSEINLLALESACKFLSQSRVKLDGTLSINVNSKDLFSESFVNSIKDAIDKYKISPQKIELEILEDELIEDFKTIKQNMKELQKFGVKFSIDDFGTGYSSILYLQKLCVDSIKIDKHFIQNIEEKSNRELIRMIHQIAKTFDLDFIVEGVETQEHLQFLKDNEIKFFQGFYYSKAVKVENFLNLLLHNH